MNGSLRHLYSWNRGGFCQIGDSSAVRQDIVDDILAADGDQEIVDDNPLIVPAHVLLDFLEGRGLVGGSSTSLL
jgi:hypothetical protein